MYKTIRHGENSLQYTILPQNDDFRLEGKLTSNSSKGGSASRQAQKRGRKRSFFAYFGLVFVCTVIVGAILVPFLVSTEYLSAPSVWFLKRKIFLSDSSIYNNNTRINATESNANNGTMTSRPGLPMEISTADERKTLNIIQVLSTQTSKINVSSSGKIGSNYADNIAQIYSNNSTTRIWKEEAKPVATSKIQETTTEKQFLLTSTPDYKEPTVTVPNKIQTSKSPVILPVLAKTNSVVKENGRWVKNRSEPQGWIRSHWPFIDPSTYFQWAGYKSEDSVLLPAILGAALVGIILVITLCLVARNKKVIVASMKRRNRHVVNENTEDNTTLLANGNVSDEE